MSDPRCGCCTGTDALTPVPTANRPGLHALNYRVGTHAAFLQTMLARLSSHRLEDGQRPLQRLTTRSADDPAIALLDAWATVGDVLSFYQERIANEGYLPTATERRSVLELARLVGYRLRPGVAASLYLAFTLEKDYAIDVPAGTRAQSIPETDELPQMFEIEEDLPARAEWNAIPARRTRPMLLRHERFDGTRTLRIRGAVSGLKANGVLLFVCGEQAHAYSVREIEPDPKLDVTVVGYAPYGSDVPEEETPGPGILAATVTTAPGSHSVSTSPAAGRPALARLGDMVKALRAPSSVPPASRHALDRPLQNVYNAASDLGPQLLAQFTPRLRDTLFDAYARAPAAGTGQVSMCRLEAMRVKAGLFGSNAPKRIVLRDGELNDPEDWDLASTDMEGLAAGILHLDAVYDQITPGSWIVITHVTMPSASIAVRVVAVREVFRADYGISARVTRLQVEWPGTGDGIHAATLGSVTMETSIGMSAIGTTGELDDSWRGFTIHAQSEPLDLAEELIEEPVADDRIELDGFYDGLEAGRWLMVSGIRADVPGFDESGAGEGVEASELAMLAGVVHDVHRVTVPAGGAGNIDANGEHSPDDPPSREIELPGDTLHTRLILAEPLAYAYRRGSVRINANVARATHGETRREVLGSGNGAQAFQQFALKQRPLTYVSAPNEKGIESTLDVRVDDIRWPRQDTLLALGEGGRGYIVDTGDDGTVRITFGDGRYGARLPTGVENVSAVYRSGIGKAGNVRARQVSVLAMRPLGVKDVINPQRASGGADPESRDQARRNAPLAVLALDRLVSVQDHADFARTFAGIGKAGATALSDGRRECVHLTVAGVDDAPIDAGSDLQRNLLLALRRLGDPGAALRVEPREAMFLVLGARIKVHADHLWSNVEPRLRAVLLDTFGFDRRELGQSVLLGEAIGAMQAVDGVDYVDVDLFDAIAESDAADPEALAARLEALAGAGDAAAGCDCESCAQPRRRIAVRPARIDPVAGDPALRILPAQIAYLNPELPDTLILTEMSS